MHKVKLHSKLFFQNLSENVFKFLSFAEDASHIFKTFHLKF